MRRVLFAGALALVALLGVQVAASLVPSACTDGSRDGCGDGTCPPGCGECVCCPSTRVVSSAAVLAVRVPDARPYVHPALPQAPADAEPGEILHVPKSA